MACIGTPEVFVVMVGLWRVVDGRPERLAVRAVDAERSLEDWIAEDPSLLEQGLEIVGRQLRTDAGPLDLLALDPQGRWVIVEVKRDTLRREAVAQAIDYASCVERMGPEALRECCDRYLGAQNKRLESILSERGRTLGDEDDRREVIIYLVGMREDPGLRRMVGFLAERADLVVRVVTLTMFENGRGEIMLARTIHEADGGGVVRRGAEPSMTVDLAALRQQADENGIAEVFDTLASAALEVGLYPRIWKTSVMFAPAENKTRCVLTVWTKRRPQAGTAKVFITEASFEEFLGVPQGDVEASIGTGFMDVDPEGARRIAATLRELVKSGTDT